MRIELCSLDVNIKMALSRRDAYLYNSRRPVGVTVVFDNTVLGEKPIRKPYWDVHTPQICKCEIEFAILRGAGRLRGYLIHSIAYESTSQMRANDEIIKDIRSYCCFAMASLLQFECELHFGSHRNYIRRILAALRPYAVLDSKRGEVTLRKDFDELFFGAYSGDTQSMLELTDNIPLVQMRS